LVTTCSIKKHTDHVTNLQVSENDSYMQIHQTKLTDTKLSRVFTFSYESYNNTISQETFIIRSEHFMYCTYAWTWHSPHNLRFSGKCLYTTFL